MKRSLLRVLLVVAALAAGAVLTAVLVGGRGGDGAAGAAQPLPSIQGPQLRLAGLVYNVTDVRILDPDRPDDAPYLVNLQRDPGGGVYFGVFLKIYNLDPDEDRTSAPGFLLEPIREPGLVALNQATESPYRLDQGGVVPAGGQLPDPEAPTGPYEGGLLLYIVNGPMTKAQPFQLVVHAGTDTGAIKLPTLPQLTGGGH